MRQSGTWTIAGSDGTYTQQGSPPAARVQAIAIGYVHGHQLPKRLPLRQVIVSIDLAPLQDRQSLHAHQMYVGDPSQETSCLLSFLTSILPFLAYARAAQSARGA